MLGYQCARDSRAVRRNRSHCACRVRARYLPMKLTVVVPGTRTLE